MYLSIYLFLCDLEFTNIIHQKSKTLTRGEGEKKKSGKLLKACDAFPIGRNRYKYYAFRKQF